MKEMLFGAVIGFAICINLVNLGVKSDIFDDIKSDKVIVSHECGTFDKDGVFKWN